MWKASIRLTGLALMAAIFSCSCATSGGKAITAGIDASFAEIKDDPRGGILLELDRTRDGVQQFRLIYPDLGQVAIKGTAEREGESWLLKFESLDWFNNWSNGWTEASFLLEGESNLTPAPSGGAWILSLRSMPRLDSVRSATIRYYDTYLRGPKGLEEFSHRWERIQAVCAVLLRGSEGPGLARRPDAIERFLFPELYGYDEPPSPNFRKAFGRGQEWNADYSAEHFSELLARIRNDGTMLRDYKESPGLWRLALAWEDFWEHRGYAAGLWPLPATK
jgi:hypothetical protein